MASDGNKKLMNQRIIFLALVVCCTIRMQAQVRYLDDSNTSINMGIEAKAKSAYLNLETFSRTSQIQSDPYVVITFMNDSVINLTGKGRNDNIMHSDDQGHGFANRFNSKARFIISPAQAEMFKAGVKSLMIRMVPTAFYHEWAIDEIGLPLYTRYTTSKESVMFKRKKKGEYNMGKNM
jgi:hypothetical protein